MGRKISLLWIVLSLGCGLFALPQSLNAQGAGVFNNSGLPIPRFVSLRSDKVFVRTGPAVRYPIKWVFVKEGLPIEIIQEFDTWRKIRDINGQEGWIHQSLLSGKRSALIAPEKGAVLVRKPVSDARPVALLEKNVLVRLGACSGAWCMAAASSYKGWIERKSLWGVYPDEELD